MTSLPTHQSATDGVDAWPDPTPVATVTTVTSDERDHHPAWQRFTRWTAPDLMAETFPPQRWAVPDLIPEGLTLLVGAPKVGKSWAALDVALAVASGGHALGTLPTELGPVLYLALEDGPQRLQGRLSLLLGGDPAPSGLTMFTSWSVGRDAVADVRSWLAENPGTRLVVVDVLAKVRRGLSSSGNLYAEDYAEVGRWQTLATEYGTAVLMLHHDRKAASDDLVLAVSGTNGVAGSADTVLHLTRSRMEDYGSLSLTGRDVLERVLTLHRVGPSWRVHDGPAPDPNLGEATRRIVEAVVAGATGPTAIAAATGLDPANVRVNLGRLVDSGRLVKRGRGLYAVTAEVTDVTIVTRSEAEPAPATLRERAPACTRCSEPLDRAAILTGDPMCTDCVRVALSGEPS